MTFFFSLLAALGILCRKHVSKEFKLVEVRHGYQLILRWLQSFISTNTICTPAKNIHSYHCSTKASSSPIDWYLNGCFSRMACSWYILQHIPARSRWVLFEDKRPVNLWTMAQWIKHNMCGQEYQGLLWVSLLSTSQGTPQIIVQLRFLNSKCPRFFSPPALTHSLLS